MDQRPIGIFDSGLGGLTAAAELERILPGENLIYFGDSANAPYGTRSPSCIAALARANAGFLCGFDCKAILVACGTVSSNAMDVLERSFSLPIFGVIDAPCRRAAALTRTKRIAVVATDATIRSNAFARTLQSLNSELEVYSDSCQSLVALAEQGHFSAGDPAAERAVSEELNAVRRWAPDVLILACTHFPLFQEVIAAYMGEGVQLLSVGAEAALALKEHLTQNGLLAQRRTGTHRWFTSGSTADFAAMGAKLLGHDIFAEAHINTESETL